MAIGGFNGHGVGQKRSKQATAKATPKATAKALFEATCEITAKRGHAEARRTRGSCKCTGARRLPIRCRLRNAIATFGQI